MIKKLAISFLIGLILSAGAIYFSFKHVPLAELSQYLVSIDYRWAVPSLGLVVLTLILRAFRWRFILAPGNRITVAQAFNPMMIGFMINCVLPGRLGELARPMALRQNSGVAFGTGLATVAAERFFDLFLNSVVLIPDSDCFLAFLPS